MYTERPRKFIKALKLPLSEIRHQLITVARSFDDLVIILEGYAYRIYPIYKSS